MTDPNVKTRPRVLSATTIVGDDVVNRAGEGLGEIEDLMIDLAGGRIRYAVLSFGGLLGIGDKLFAVPFEALELDAGNERFVLDVARETLEEAPGFDKENWPDTAEETWQVEVYRHYGYAPYWR